MKANKKNLREKVRSEIDFLRSVEAAETANAISVETLKNLELLLENFISAHDRTNAIKNDLKMARANAVIAKDELRAIHKDTQKKINRSKAKKKQKKSK